MKINIGMKAFFLIWIMSVFLVSALVFFVIDAQDGYMGFAGLVTHNDSFEDSVVSNEILDEKMIVTKEEALLAINESEQIIKEMQENNFSVLYMNDSLTEAKIIFEQAKYAEILRNTGSSKTEKEEARINLRLVSWKEIDYGVVIDYTDEIKDRRVIVFLLVDKIAVEESKVNPEGMGLYGESLFSLSSETMQILEGAKIAFKEDRYEESESLLEEFKIAFEREKMETSLLSGIKKGYKNFFQKYWNYLIVVLVLLSVMGYFIYKKLEKKLLKREIKKMEVEKGALIRLMKKNQEERFKKNIISGLVYNIRAKKYQEKLQEIKQRLPVLKIRLGNYYSP